MLSLSHARARPAFGVVGAALVVALAAVLISTNVGVGSAAAPPAPATPAALASTVPRLDTPEILNGEVHAILRVGNRVLVGGIFTQVRDAGSAKVLERRNLLAYDATTGRLDLAWKPWFDDDVLALALSSDGSTVFVGGEFDSVDGVARANLVALRAADGSVDTGFTVQTDRKVTALTVHDDTLFVGGTFGLIGGVPRKRLAAVLYETGVVDPTFDVPVEQPTGPAGGSSVKRLEVTPDGTTLMSVHNDRLVGGQVRTGVALIDLSGPQATVKPWHTDVWENNRCSPGAVTRVRDGDISPDGSYLVVVGSGDDRPPACDTAVALPLAGEGLVRPLWVSRHFDTIESVEITWNAVYVGGHFQFQEAPGSPDPWPGEQFTAYGQGAAAVLGDQVVPREKLGALHPYDGKALPWPASANGFRGVFELVASGGQLLLGHDGNLVDDRPLGRHGSFPLPAQPPGAEPVLPAGLDHAGAPGYWMAETDGDLYDFGAAVAYASAGVTTIDIGTDRLGRGVWVLGADGVVTTRGGAAWYGDVDPAALLPGEVPSAIAVRPGGDGYWVFTDRGRALAFGAATWLGDVTHLQLDGPVIASVATASGGGYWMIGSDGGVFTFGDARFLGSTGGMRLDAPVVGMAADPDGSGYWLVAADGGVFAFDAEFRGSLPGILSGQQLQGPIVAIVGHGDGYVMLGSDGGAFSFSNLGFLGSLGAAPPDTPVVAIAAFG